MDETTARKIAAFAESFQSTWGIPLLWRFAGQDYLRQVVPESVYHHCNSFCMNVKNYPQLYAKCQARESTELVAEVFRQRQPFLKKCHAGVVEWVVPLFCGQNYDGVLIVGPFRQARGACPYPQWQIQQQFEQLSVYREESMQMLIPLLDILVGFIVMRREQLLQARMDRIGDPRIARAVRYVDEHYDEDGSSVAGIASECGLSPSRFMHLFKSETGIRFTEYLHKVRIREAQRLLRFTNETIGEIARHVGFRDQSYFGAVFKRVTGTTPRRFRSGAASSMVP